MKLFRIIVGFLLVVILLSAGVYASGLVYFVPEYKNVVVTRFGEVQYAVVTGVDGDKNEIEQQRLDNLKDSYGPGMVREGAGIYFKLPFVEQAHYFDSRILFWDGRASEISTMDLRTLLIEASGRWRIFDVIKFYQALGTEVQALNRIGSVINSNIEDYISETRLIEAVRNENLELETEVLRRLEAAEVVEEIEGELEEIDATRIRHGRKELLNRIENETDQSLLDEFGVKLVDIMFAQLNYTETVREDVYERMKAERDRIAARNRAEGERIRREILGEVSRQEDEMLSDAQRQVREIEGEAEQRRIEIEAEAYQKDPEFFRFQRSLQAYRTGLTDNAIFILSDDNDLLEFTTSAQ